MREAYGDIFLIKEHPTNADSVAIAGKFKSFHNASENVAGLMAKTFLSLLPLADLSSKPSSSPTTQVKVREQQEQISNEENPFSAGELGLHYNIQIHLPATKDVEVYNAIFKSLREHFLAK